MNTKILQKVLEELNREKPDISYIRGMVEVLASSEEGTGSSASRTVSEMQLTPSGGGYIAPTGSGSLDKTAILDAKAKAAVSIIQSLKDNPPVE